MVVKWLLNETDSSRALRLRFDALSRGQDLIAPAHIIAETVSAIYKRVQQRGISLDEAVSIVGELQRVSIESVTPPGLLARALEVATQFQLKWIYDAFYVALAEIVGCDLWTADEALYAAVHNGYANVHLLSEYPLD